MSKKEKVTKEKKEIKVISSDTSVKLPDEIIDDKEAVKELLKILKPQITAPKPVSPKPIKLGLKTVAPKPITVIPTTVSPKPITVGPKPIKPLKTSVAENKPSITVSKKLIEIPSPVTPETPATTEEEADIIIPDKIEEEGEVSEDLLRISSILKGIKEEEIAYKEEELKSIPEIPDTKTLGIHVECPHCGRKILLDKLEFLKQGYSDYCPYCELMLLPNILPDDYKPPEEKELQPKEEESSFEEREF